MGHLGFDPAPLGWEGRRKEGREGHSRTRGGIPLPPTTHKPPGRHHTILAFLAGPPFLLPKPKIRRGFTLQRGKGRRSAPELLLCLLFRRRHSIRLQRCPTGTASAGGGPHDCRRRKMFLQREGGSGLVQFRILPSTPGPKRQRGTRSNCPFDLVLRRRRLWVTVGPEWRTDIWEEGK